MDIFQSLMHLFQSIPLKPATSFFWYIFFQNVNNNNNTFIINIYFLCQKTEVVWSWWYCALLSTAAMILVLRLFRIFLGNNWTEYIQTCQINLAIRCNSYSPVMFTVIKNSHLRRWSKCLAFFALKKWWKRIFDYQNSCRRWVIE